eukprot:CAMPEP_0181458500 /NCGR_PEP_ID=MMETSP1110-20121109/32341_1 /TAXON_ID=174948 /ORGANISM="Symbiodinium sp., Strain CCMP421" /LENGTH=211 /DNA_ID=CAMNT_0023582989 /DNA_START=92 /DNA_END=726 /DNA_ORIENTATION=+
MAHSPPSSSLLLDIEEGRRAVVMCLYEEWLKIACTADPFSGVVQPAKDILEKQLHFRLQPPNIQGLGLTSQASRALDELAECDLPISIVQEFEETQEVVIVQLELTHPELQLGRCDKLGKLLEIQRSVPCLVHGLKQPSNLVGVCYDVPLLLFEGQFFVEAGCFHGLLHEDRIYDIQHCKSNDASVNQEKQREPFAHVVHEDSTGWGPIGE